MTGDKPEKLYNIAPLTAKMLTEEPEYAWSRKWVIINTLGTLLGAMTGLVALVAVAVIALTS